MNRLKETINNLYYRVPIRVKLLIASGIIFILTIIASFQFLTTFNEIITNEQFIASSKKIVNVVSYVLANNFTIEDIEHISELYFIEKITIRDTNESVTYEWATKDYNWKHLSYFQKEIKNSMYVLIIAIDRKKYIATNELELSKQKHFTLYITSLLALLIILIVNLLIIKPIDSVSNTLDKYLDKEEENDDDDKSKSKIIELSKTIGLLKRSISQKKEKERQLVNIQKRLSSVLNTIGDTIITINKESKIVMVNPAFEKIWGHDKESVLGKNLEEMMPEQYRDLHRAGLQRYLKTGTENVMNQNLELEALHANGKVFPIDIHISETRIDDELFFTAAIRDITNRKKIEKELVEAKENVEEMLELRTHDLVTRLNELNCLYSLSKLIEEDKQNISHILKETLVLITTACKFTDKVCCLIKYRGHEYKTKNYIETKWKLKQDITIKDSKLGYICLCYLEEIYPNTDEQFLRYEEKMLDIVCVRLSRYLEHNKAKEELDNANQELRDTQLQLIQAEKLDTIGTLSAGVAHEVKNPLAVIQLGIDYLNKKSVDNENIKDVITEMDEAIARADSVIKELVNFSASNELTLEPLNVNQLIDDALSMVKHETLKNNITIDKNYDKSLSTISGDKQKLGQVIINLVINAIHAMEKSDEKLLKLMTYPSNMADMGLDITGKFNINDTIVAISIEDTGTGIKEEKMEKLFEPFYTTKASGKGTGLGLTVCQNIVRLHGGSLMFENAKSGGAKVTLLFKA